MKHGMPLMMGRLVLLAVLTTANIVLDILSHLWPVEGTVNHFHGFSHANMAGHLTVMLGFHYSLTERGITLDPDPTFVEEYSIFVYNQRRDTPFQSSVFHCFII